MADTHLSDFGDLIDGRSADEGALLPILHDIQHAYGHIPPAAIGALAEALNISKADVHGVVTFYADFTTEPLARHRLQLCVSEACQARGVAQTQHRLEQATGLKIGDQRADGSLSLEPIYCLGLCATGPAALVDGEPRAKLVGERLETLIAEAVR